MSTARLTPRRLSHVDREGDTYAAQENLELVPFDNAFNEAAATVLCLTSIEQPFNARGQSQNDLSDVCLERSIFNQKVPVYFTGPG